MLDKPGILVKLPPDMHYLIEPALKYGGIMGHDAIFEFLESVTEEQIDELRAVAARMLANDDCPRVYQFLDEFEITDYEECAHLYFMIGIMDELDLQFDRVPES